MSEHRCHALYCKVVVPPRMLMCPRHWAMVPKDIQSQVWAEYRPGQEITKNPTQAWSVAAGRAIREVYLAEHAEPAPERNTP